jgi:hypothetical protein
MAWSSIGFGILESTPLPICCLRAMVAGRTPAFRCSCGTRLIFLSCVVSWRKACFALIHGERGHANAPPVPSPNPSQKPICRMLKTSGSR